MGKSIERHVEEGDKIEDQHIDGMAGMKEACESKTLFLSPCHRLLLRWNKPIDMVTLIDSLAPQSL